MRLTKAQGVRRQDDKGRGWSEDGNCTRSA
jgi:hypothetical protein